MISLEKAKALKEAGLTWEPQEGDCISELWNRGVGEYRKIKYLNSDDIEEYEECYGALWLPSLSQLLAEIERWGYDYDISRVKASNRPYGISVYSIIRCLNSNIEDAAADALLWIIESKKKEGSKCEGKEATQC